MPASTSLHPLQLDMTVLTATFRSLQIPKAKEKAYLAGLLLQLLRSKIIEKHLMVTRAKGIFIRNLSCWWFAPV